MNRALPILDWAFSQPEKACLVTDERSYSYNEVSLAIQHVAASLAGMVGVGTHVGLFIDSTPNFIVYQHAVYYLGGIIMPLNRAMMESEVGEVVMLVGLSLVVSDSPLELPEGVANVVVEGEFDIPASGPEIPPPANLSPEAGACLLQTSGSTGQPKGVLLSMGNLSSNYDASYRWIGIGKEDRILLTLPVFNTYALNQGINMMAMTGATLRLVRRFSPARMQEIMDEFQPTFIPLVPTMLTRLHQAGVMFEGKVRVGIGAAASPSQIAGDAWAVFPHAHIYFGYGLTEATAIVTTNHVGTKEKNTGDYRSAGPVVPGVQVVIRDPSGEDRRGEVLVSGGLVFNDYVGTTESRPVEKDWLLTGDIGLFDNQNRLHIVDRKRELIIRGGQNIYPGEIERVLSSHAAVSEAAAVSRSDADFGEVPIAFVVVRRGMEVTAVELLEWASMKLATFKVPADIFIIEVMPKTPTGKIRKLDLRDGREAHASSR
jgi:long-chain acyl-CoA synthetase